MNPLDILYLLPKNAAMSRIDQIITEKGLWIVSDGDQLEPVVLAVLARNPKAVADFKAGKKLAIGSMVGQVLREIKGADPIAVQDMILDKIVNK